MVNERLIVVPREVSPMYETRSQNICGSYVEGLSHRPAFSREAFPHGT